MDATHEHRRRNNLNCDLDTSVPDWIIDHPESAAVFDELRIDTSCAGKSLEYVCRQQGPDTKCVLQRLLQVIDNHHNENTHGAG